MLRNTLVACVAAVAALVVAPSVASAGPIPWAYHTYIGPEDLGQFIHLGYITRMDGRRAEMYSGLRGEEVEGFGNGSRQLRLGSLLDMDVHHDWLDDTGYSGPRAGRFETVFTIIDGDSGESGTVTAFGRGLYTGDEAMYEVKVALEMLEGSKQELTLGGNRYEVEFTTTPGDGDIVFLNADVTVTSAQTPEPATLALAGVGLLASAGLSLRRRRMA